MSAERALFLSEAVLCLVRPGEVAQGRRMNSGLVQLQDLFRRLPKP